MRIRLLKLLNFTALAVAITVLFVSQSSALEENKGIRLSVFDWELADEYITLDNDSVRLIFQTMESFRSSNENPFSSFNYGRFYEPRFVGYDLNRDGVSEYLLDVNSFFTGVERLQPYIPVIVVQVDVISDQAGNLDRVIKYLGVIPAGRALFYNRPLNDLEMRVSHEGNQEWLSISNGKLISADPVYSTGDFLIGGARFCWTDDPSKKIDWRAFGWDPAKVATRYGIPYKEGDPGYHLLVPESEPCPE